MNKFQGTFSPRNRTDVRDGPFSPLSGDLERVRKLIPEGGQKAVTAENIANLTGLSLRRIRDIINTLIMQHNIPIAGSRAENLKGYYIITNEVERQAALTPLLRQQAETARRIQKLETMPINKA